MNGTLAVAVTDSVVTIVMTQVGNSDDLRCTNNTLVSYHPHHYLRKREADAGDVHIRVIFSGDKHAEVKPGMAKR